MIEEIWDVFPTPVNPREALWTTFPRRGRKGGIRRAEDAREARVARGDRESGAEDPARGPAAVRDAVPP